MTNTTRCCICGEILNLKSDEIVWLDDLPAHWECANELRGDEINENRKNK
jgi:hypothetical protein